jgi:hypothetical protein
MGAATITAGSEHWGKLGTFDTYLFKTTTAGNAEDGVDVVVPMTQVIGAFVMGAASGKYGPFYATLSGVTVTIKGAAVSGADSAAVWVLVLGFK